MTTPPTFALFVVSSLLAFPALGADRVVQETGEFESDPALRVAWLQARQREGGGEYALAPSGGVFHGHNAAHGFSVALDSGTVRLDGDGARFALVLDGVGRAGDLEAPAAVSAVESDGKRVSWHRGALTEWYVNGPLGLEQGFDLSEPVPGVGEVVLSLVVTGDVTPVADGESVRLVTGGGPTWELGDLLVVDAGGRRLPSRMTVSGDRVALRFDDHAAVYPVLVDPFIKAEEDKLVAGDPAGGDSFGFSVAVSGDTAVFGSPFDDDGGSNSGSAYVFVRSGTTWTEQDKLVAGDAAADDNFGRSVSVSGDTAVVGSPFDDDGGSNSGSAYVFVRSLATWSEQQKLVASDAAAGDAFGASVALLGGTALVGSPFDDDGGSDSGSAYVFVRSGTTWTEQQQLVASDGAADDHFGWSSAVSGDTAVVGASFDNPGLSLSGLAYVFMRTGTVWIEQGKLVAGDTVSGDAFGHSVAVSGDMAVVGAPFDDRGDQEAGGAYAFNVMFDWDADGVLNRDDNCLVLANADQDDADSDGLGDACDDTDGRDLDGDGVANLDDNCPFVANPGQEDSDADDLGDACDDTDGLDADGDGVANLDDNCPFAANPGQEDSDADDLGDACDDTDGLDADGDGVANLDDNCPFVANPGQEDADADDLGDACDDTDGLDADGDGIANLDDNCPFVANPGQEDADADDLGDACDDTDNSDSDDSGDGDGEGNGCGCAGPGIPAVSPSLLLGMALLIRRRPRPSP